MCGGTPSERDVLTVASASRSRKKAPPAATERCCRCRYRYRCHRRRPLPPYRRSRLGRHLGRLRLLLVLARGGAARARKNRAPARVKGGWGCQPFLLHSGRHTPRETGRNPDSCRFSEDKQPSCVFDAHQNPIFSAGGTDLCSFVISKAKGLRSHSLASIPVVRSR